MKSDRQLKVSAVALMGLIATVGLMRGLMPVGVSASVQQPTYDEFRDRASIAVGGTVRNFAGAADPGGHPDFERPAAGGVGRYARIAHDRLDGGGKPAMLSTGYRVLADWKDGAGRPVIASKEYVAAFPGDTAGELAPDTGGAVTSPTSFGQWFRDVPGVNTMQRTDFALTAAADGSGYVFDGSLDSFAGAPDYTYTCEVSVPFLFESGRGWHVTAATNADVWAYVDDALVIDGGSGLGHSASLAVDGQILMSNTASIVGAGGAPVSVSTNSTAPGAFSMTNSASVAGDAFCGPGGVVASVIQTPSGGAIAGDRAALPAPVPMPELDAPTDLGASVGDRTYAGVTATISSSFRASTVVIRGNSTVSISGDVVILAEELFEVSNNCEIRLLPGARLTIYVEKAIELHNNIRLNNGGDPSNVRIMNLGTTDMTIDNHVSFAGRIVSPRSRVTIGNNATVTGSILAASARMTNSGQLVGSGAATDALAGASALMTQRIDLDRLGWLSEGRTHTLRIFFANRTGSPSRLRLETNMELLNVAAVPLPTQSDPD